MVKLDKGSIEYVPCKITDALDNITDLTGTNPQYQFGIKDANDLSSLASAVIDDTDKMLLLCLIDTSALAVGSYDLYIQFAIAPQFPRLKFDFMVN